MSGLFTAAGRAVRAGGLVLTALAVGGAPAVHAATERVIHAFTGGPDGAGPVGGLIVIGGTLRTTVGDNCGTVFALSPAGAGGGRWTKTVLHQFAPGGDGCRPDAGLLHLGNSFYGTTYGGGTFNAGTVFRLAAPAVAGGAWTETVLHSFPNITCADASTPYGKRGVYIRV